MKTAQPSSMRMPLGVLAASALALLMPTSVAASGLKIRNTGGPAPAAASGPAPGPAPGPAAPAPPPIRPGVVVRVTKSKEQLQANFKGQPIRYSPLMDEMVGKDYVVKTMGYSGAGLAAPDGTQGNVWYFPLTALTPWLATPDAKKPPVAAQAYKVVGLPTRAKVEIGPPGRHDAPWDYTIKGRNLMDPIAPSYNQRVDLEKTRMPLPPWMKVKQVISVECMEKLHKDPKHLCDPEAYVNYAAVAPKPTPEKPMTQAEGQALKDKIQHLKKTIKSLSPKDDKKPTELTFKAPLIRGTKETMNTMGANAEGAQAGANHKMAIGKEGSGERLHTAQGHGESIRVHYSSQGI